MKSAVFGSSSVSCLSPLIGAGGGLVCESVGKADMLSAHCDGKQSRDPVDLPSTCHQSPSLTTFAFRSREVKRLLLDLDSNGGTDPLGMAHSVQSALEMGQEARIVQIDFRTSFARVNHQGILFKLCSVGVGGSDTVSL